MSAGPSFVDTEEPVVVCVVYEPVRLASVPVRADDPFILLDHDAVGQNPDGAVLTTANPRIEGKPAVRIGDPAEAVLRIVDAKLAAHGEIDFHNDIRHGVSQLIPDGDVQPIYPTLIPWAHESMLNVIPGNHLAQRRIRLRERSTASPGENCNEQHEGGR
jgi:hypothetical protein